MVGTVEGSVNLLSGALPGFPDYVPFMNKARLPYFSEYSEYTEFVAGLGTAARVSMARSSPEVLPTNTSRVPLADPMLAESTLGSSAALREFEQLHHGPSRPSDIKELKTGSDQDRLGDFSDMSGATMQDLMSRIPTDASVRKLKPAENGSQVGAEYKWVDENGVTNRLRAHDPDPSAPQKSNASDGWIFRYQNGKRYYDPLTNDYKHPNSYNPDSPFHDANAANNTHVPMTTPDDWLIELMKTRPKQ